MLGFLKKLFGSTTENTESIANYQTLNTQKREIQIDIQEPTPKHNLHSRYDVKYNSKNPISKIQYKIKGHSSKKYVTYSSFYNELYEVDMNNLTCTCGHQKFSRKHMSTDSYTYLCRHLIDGFEKENMNIEIISNNPLINHHFQTQKSRRFPVATEYVETTIDHNDVVIVQYIYSGWVEVITRKKRQKDNEVSTGEIEIYSLNENRVNWSYQSPPPNAKLIKDFINELDKVFCGVDLEQNDSEFPLSNLQNYIKDGYFPSSNVYSEIQRQTRYETDIDKIVGFAQTETLIYNNELADHKLIKNYIDHRDYVCKRYLDIAKILIYRNDQRFDKFHQNALFLNPEIQETINKDVLFFKDNKDIIKKYETINLDELLKRIEFRHRKIQKDDNKNVISDIFYNEKNEFESLKTSKFKQQALDLHNFKHPDYYKPDRHANMKAYNYADFVKAKYSKEVTRYSESRNICINFIASEAIMEGMMSDSVIAQLYRIKGEIYLQNDNVDVAIKLFSLALNHDENVGVKTIYKKLKNSRQFKD